MKIDRRDALGYIAAGSAALGVSTLFPTQALAAVPDLAVIKGDDPAANVRAALGALGGMSRFVSKGETVVLKPNMGFGNAPLRTSTTEPKVVRAMAEEALNAGAKKVLVFDFPCHKPKIVLDVCGIKKELKGLDDVHTYTIQGNKMFKKVDMPYGKALKSQEVFQDIIEADSIINLPVAKSHGGSKVTFGMKNWMGVVKNRRYWHVWVDLHQAIADFALYMKKQGNVKLTLIDATRALLTGGPGGPGKVASLKTVVAGTDPVAVDSYGVTLAPWNETGYKISEIPHIVMAAELGVGSLDLNKLNILKKSV
jgi:uncharacterized protein (DUF362 family)